MENANPTPPQLPKSKDGLLGAIGIFVFAYMFLGMIMQFAGLYYGGINVFTNFLYLGIYAIPFLLSFAVQKRGMKTTLLIFGIISLVIGIWNFIYSSFMMGSYYYNF